MKLRSWLLLRVEFVSESKSKVLYHTQVSRELRQGLCQDLHQGVIGEEEELSDCEA